ncbi:MAG: glycosyltransferase [Bacteroidia bacterium]|nr:glycosyltransferase [Bacteroidia bacterium]
MLSTPRHIVFITPGFARDETDTISVPYLQVYFKALQNQGSKISIITLHYPSTNTVYKWNNCDVYSFAKYAKWQKPLLWIKAIKTIIRINSTEPISNIHSFWLGECALVGHWAAKIIRVKHLNTLMGQDVLQGNKFCKILPIKKMNLVTLSPFHQQVFLKNYQIETPIVFFGVNKSDVKIQVAKSIDFIGVGSLIPIKNYSLFIDVIHEINKTIPVSAIIIGEGEEFDILAKKIKDLNPDPSGDNVIKLLGLLNNEQVLGYLAQSKILLHTSNHEGFGMIFAEALQQETMVVSTPVGSIFESPNVMLANNKSDLVKSCQTMLTKTFDPNFPNPFDIEKTIENYNYYYKDFKQ